MLSNSLRQTLIKRTSSFPLNKPSIQYNFSFKKGSNLVKLPQRSFSRYFSSSKKKLSYFEELEHMDRNHDYSKMKGDFKIGFMFMLTFCTFYKAMGMPNPFHWGNESKSNRGLSLSYETENYIEEEDDN